MKERKDVHHRIDHGHVQRVSLSADRDQDRHREIDHALGQEVIREVDQDRDQEEDHAAERQDSEETTIVRADQARGLQAPNERSAKLAAQANHDKLMCTVITEKNVVVLLSNVSEFFEA